MITHKITHVITHFFLHGFAIFIFCFFAFYHSVIRAWCPVMRICCAVVQFCCFVMLFLTFYRSVTLFLGSVILLSILPNVQLCAYVVLLGYFLSICCFVIIFCHSLLPFYRSFMLFCFAVLPFCFQFATTKSDFDSLHEDATVLWAKNKEKLIRFTLQDFSFSLLLCIRYLFVSGCCLTHAY